MRYTKEGLLQKHLSLPFLNLLVVSYYYYYSGSSFEIADGLKIVREDASCLK
jgi:hypothetical protein